jgi:hypothetical protein
LVLFVPEGAGTAPLEYRFSLDPLGGSGRFDDITQFAGLVPAAVTDPKGGRSPAQFRRLAGAETPTSGRCSSTTPG